MSEPVAKVSRAEAAIVVPPPRMPATEVPLGLLRDLLAPLPGDLVVSNGFTMAHSWRGIYAEVAFEPAEDVTVAGMAHEVWKALTMEFYGYKGGEYTYNEHTAAHLSRYGSSVEYDWAPLIDALQWAAQNGSSEVQP